MKAFGYLKIINNYYNFNKTVISINKNYSNANLMFLLMKEIFNILVYIQNF
jgi:hypothetical protein